jgi:tRNA-Thr(GGU) m(6)t(6)A37 methyltransferase TsaA
MVITYSQIGTIHSPFDKLAGMPIQPSSEYSAAGYIELLPELTEGLKDLDGFSHIILVYHLHRSHKTSMRVVPFLDSEAHGIFATRAPHRPNPIGISVVKLTRIEDNLLYVENLDVLDGTPLLDIKPYVPEFDSPTVFKLGWLEKAKGKVHTTQSDERFQD